jgi:adenylosuccinate lyase
MRAVAAGGDRQALHERIRVHSQEAARRVKADGEPNDLIDRLRRDDAFAGVDLDAALNALDFVGRAPEQVDQFIAEHVDPIRQQYEGGDALSTEVTV